MFPCLEVDAGKLLTEISVRLATKMLLIALMIYKYIDRSHIRVSKIIDYLLAEQGQ
jgi:hypothetical protein